MSVVLFIYEFNVEARVCHTVVYFDKSRSKLEKRYLRVRRVAKYEQRKQIVEVNYSDFKFGPIK